MSPIARGTFVTEYLGEVGLDLKKQVFVIPRILQLIIS